MTSWRACEQLLLIRKVPLRLKQIQRWNKRVNEEGETLRMERWERRGETLCTHFKEALGLWLALGGFFLWGTPTVVPRIIKQYLRPVFAWFSAHFRDKIKHVFSSQNVYRVDARSFMLNAFKPWNKASNWTCWSLCSGPTSCLVWGLLLRTEFRSLHRKGSWTLEMEISPAHSHPQGVT